jgi:hypothetical protein
MELGLLHLHNILRWVILLLLIVTLFHAFTKNTAIRKSSLWLLIFSHIMIVIGIYQLVAGRYGITKGLPEGIEVMKDDFYRFFWVEHPLLMFISIVLITIARGKSKVLNYKSAGWLLLIALILILAAVPWPFREIGRPLLPGM